MYSQLIWRDSVAQTAHIYTDTISEEIPTTMEGNFLKTRLGGRMGQVASVHQVLSYNQAITSTGKQNPFYSSAQFILSVRRETGCLTIHML